MALTFPTEVEAPLAETVRAPRSPLCVATSANEPSQGVQTFEFAPIDIQAVAFGPHIADMPRTGLPRSEVGMARLIAAHVPAIHECYRWARFKDPSLREAMKIHFEVSPLGEVDSFEVDVPKRWGELAPCVEAVMRSGMQAYSYTPRITSISAVLDFEPTGQALPALRPIRPQPSNEPKRGGCVDAISPTPIDEIDLRTPFVVDDFDADIADMERQRALCRSEGTSHCHITLPTDRHGGMYTVANLSPRRDAYILRKYLDFNRGSFSACFRSASTAISAPGPTVSILASIPDDGHITKASVEASSSGNTTLDECLRSALSDIWFPGAPGAGLSVVHVPFRLVPSPTPSPVPERDTASNIATYARAALDMGDGRAALARYSALVGHAPACEVHLGMLRARIALNPWIDETVMAEARRLVDDAPTGPCADAARLEIVHLAHSAHRMGDALRTPELLELAVERYKLALGLPASPLDDELHANLVDAFHKLGREDDAKAWLSKDGASIMPQAD